MSILQEFGSFQLSHVFFLYRISLLRVPVKHVQRATTAMLQQALLSGMGPMSALRALIVPREHDILMSILVL